LTFLSGFRPRPISPAPTTTRPTPRVAFSARPEKAAVIHSASVNTAWRLAGAAKEVGNCPCTGGLIRANGATFPDFTDYATPARRLRLALDGHHRRGLVMTQDSDRFSRRRTDASPAVEHLASLLRHSTCACFPSCESIRGGRVLVAALEPNRWPDRAGADTSKNPSPFFRTRAKASIHTPFMATTSAY